jgi:hypothetical protein
MNVVPSKKLIANKFCCALKLGDKNVAKPKIRGKPHSFKWIKCANSIEERATYEKMKYWP